jgi:hypothetical protein
MRKCGENRDAKVASCCPVLSGFYGKTLPYMFNLYISGQMITKAEIFLEYK